MKTLCMILKTTKHGGCKTMATHEVRQMMLDKSIGETLAMSTSIETEKANV